MSELAARMPPRLPEGQADRPRSQDCRVSSAPVRDMRLPSVVVSVLVGGTILYVARAVLMPRALAVLLTFLTFLLAPIVGFLERRRRGRVLPVLVVVVLMFVVLGGITWALARQFVSLSGEIPRYRENLKQKVADVRGAGTGGALQQVQSAAKDATEELQKEAPAPTPGDKPLPVPVPVDNTQRSEQPRRVRRTLGLRARTIESRRALGSETGWKQAGSRASYRRACWRTGSEVRRAGVGPDSGIDST